MKQEIEEKILEEGKNTIFKLGIENLHPELIRLLGKLRYRTSYGQDTQWEVVCDKGYLLVESVEGVARYSPNGSRSTSN